ncbi:MAG: 4Fe-4S dicluster domain-containing protein [Acidobacteria bacterium]|nr:4Fe-4S dicluster domain-containing protein [Acidobacteriota bacterium]
MTDATIACRERVTLEPAAVQQIIDTLRAAGYRVLGPVVGNGAIAYDDLASTDQLPAGKTDRQLPGSYKLVAGESDAWFGYASSPESWKRYCFPPVSRLWRAERKGSGFTLVAETDASPPMAFLGVRACDIAAMRVMDRVLLQGPHADPVYRRHRERAFVVAVNCGEPGGTCFCASMGAGPQVTSGFDIALTEIVGQGRHCFVAESGSDRGAAVLGGMARRPATVEEIGTADAIVARAVTRMGRSVTTQGLAESLARSAEHPHWEAVARRCLTCANCTMVCPTCFCATVGDGTDLSGAHASRVRMWDSCFTLDFSLIHGGSVRPSPYARYRQWLTHKFSTWVDQFGTFGCVGCGRCLTWCPVGIDVTEELREIAGGNPAEPPAAPV